MATMRVQIDDQVIYEGDPVTVPRAGDVIRRDADTEARVEACTWDFGAGDGTIVVTLVVGTKPYTY